MKDYNTNTDWTRNKNSTSIIYQSADGSIIEITPDGFLAESPNNTAEMFMQLKEVSDKLFQDEDNAESRRAKIELPLFDWSEKYISETLEEQFINAHDDEPERAYHERRKQMLARVPEVLNRLTETQRRRFLLHKVKKLTTRKIAEIDGVSQQSVFESISHENFSKRIVWTAGLVSRLLHNETYTGALIQGKYACYGKKKSLLPKEQWIVHNNTHEAIIDREQFDAVARLLEESATKYQHIDRYAHEENRYAGIITCSRCGKTAIRSDNRLKEPILYYYSCPHCLSDLKYELGLKQGARFPLIKLDAIVMETLQKHMDALVQFDNLAEILSQSDPLKQKRVSLKKELAKQEKTVADAERNLSAAYTHYLAGVLDLREYELVRAKVERDKMDATARLAQIKTEQARYDAKYVLGNQWLAKYRAFRDCESPTKEMIQTLISRIILTPLTNDLNIELNFMESFEELRQLLHESGVTADERDKSDV